MKNSFEVGILGNTGRDKKVISKDHGGGTEVRVGGELYRWSSVSLAFASGLGTAG